MPELFAFLDNLVDLTWVLKNYGPLLVGLIFFLWRDARREDRLLTRVVQLEDEQRNVILPLVKETSIVITRNTEVMQVNNEVMKNLERALYRVEPCSYPGPNKPCK